MITAENIKAYFEQLTAQQINMAFSMVENDIDLDYFGGIIEGNHGVCMLIASDNSEEDKEDFDGGFIVDKEGLIQLFTESNAINTAFDEYV